MDDKVGTGRFGVQVQRVLRQQGDTLHPLHVPERRKIARAPGSHTVYHTTRLCERLMQPKSEFDLTDPRGTLISSEYNSLHDPNLRSYLYRKDIHQRLISGGFITKDDRVVCSLRTLNRYRDYLVDVEKDWSHRFRMEQKELVRAFLTLQEQGHISTDMTVTNLMNWVLQSGKDVFENQRSAYKSRSTPGLSLQQLPAIAKRCNAVSLGSTSRSELIWTAKGSQIIKDVTKEVQREMRLECRSIVSKKEKEKMRKPKKANKTTTPENKKSQDHLLSEDAQFLLQETEESFGGQGESTLDVPTPQTTSPRVASSTGDLKTDQCERFSLQKDLGDDEKCVTPQKCPCLQSPPHGSRNHICASAASDGVGSSQQNSPERNASFIKQHPFSDAKKKLSAVCQKLVTETSDLLRPASACGIINWKMTSTDSISSHLVDIQQSLLEEQFKGMVTPEELQVVLRGMVVTLVEEVNEVLIPAIVAFEYERMLATNSLNDLPFFNTSSTCKTSPVTNSSLCSTPEVRVTYPDYMMPNTKGSPMETWSISSPEDIGQDERRRLGKNVVAPTASLLLKVENIIKDIIKDSVEVFTTEMRHENAMSTVSIANNMEGKTDSAVKIPESKPEDKREMEIKEERINAVAAVTTDTSDTNIAVTMDTTAVTTDTTIVNADSSSNSRLVEQSSDKIEKITKQQLKDEMSNFPEFIEHEISNMTGALDQIDSVNSGTKSGFMVSLEKSILLSSDQVDEILEKVTFVLEEEQPCWFSSDSSPSEDGHAEVEVVSPPPNSVIFAIIQKMQLDKYLERKLVSFLAERHMASPESVFLSPVACSLSSPRENLIWSSLSKVNPHSIKVTKWLLQTIQRRNAWQGSMNSDLEEMDSRQVREKHLLCEVIQALLNHLDNMSTAKNLTRQTQSESDMRPGDASQGGSVRVTTVVSDLSLAASELTKDVMSKLLLDDNNH